MHGRCTSDASHVAQGAPLRYPPDFSWHAVGSVCAVSVQWATANKLQPVSYSQWVIASESHRKSQATNPTRGSSEFSVYLWNGISWAGRLFGFNFEIWKRWIMLLLTKKEANATELEKQTKTENIWWALEPHTVAVPHCISRTVSNSGTLNRIQWVRWPVRCTQSPPTIAIRASSMFLNKES